MKTLTNAMLINRRCRCVGETAEGWWYVNHKTIDVLAKHQNGSLTATVLTRKQLIRALEIMDKKP